MSARLMSLTVEVAATRGSAILNAGLSMTTAGGPL